MTSVSLALKVLLLQLVEAARHWFLERGKGPAGPFERVRNDGTPEPSLGRLW